MYMIVVWFVCVCSINIVIELEMALFMFGGL